MPYFGIGLKYRNSAYPARLSGVSAAYALARCCGKSVGGSTSAAPTAGAEERPTSSPRYQPSKHNPLPAIVGSGFVISGVAFPVRARGN
jgi:hypothetical protein